MSLENYSKAMSYLDIIEVELGKIAAEFGHSSFEEFFSEKSS